MKILFVCTGNICRSPMAEVIFSNLCKKYDRSDIIIKGAGTGASAGESMTPEAREALKICGECVGNKSRPSTKFELHMIDEFDYIIAMTDKHAERIGKYPNVYTLDYFAGCGDIMDPYLCPIDTYVAVCRIIQNALKVFFDKIIKTK